MAYASLFVKTFSSGSGHRFLFVPNAKKINKMEKLLLSKEQKAVIIDNLYEIRKITTDFETVLKHDYQCFHGDQQQRFYSQFMYEISRCYKRALDVLIMEGGAE